MGRPSPRRRRAILAAAVLPLAAALAAGASTSASADTAPSGTTPATVAVDALPTAQMDGVAWSQVIVGDVVYVGGDFDNARPAGAAVGTNEVVRRNLMAFSLSTGALLPWAPDANGTVRGVAASADGSTIYVVGSFTKVGGTSRSRIAAVDAATGALRTAFKPTLNSTTFAVAVSGGTVYAGGHFTSASGKTRNHAAAFDGTTGAVKTFAPSTNNDVLALAVKGTSVVLAGRFDTVNGSTQRGSQLVDTATGKKNLAWAVNDTIGNNGPAAAVWSLDLSGDVVYGTGYSYHPTTKGKRIEGAFAASMTTGKLVWIEDCHGDSYSTAVTNGVLYLAGHSHYCGNVGGFDEVPEGWQRALAFSTAATTTVKTNTIDPYSDFGGTPAPSILQFYPKFAMGTFTGQYQGPWSVVAKGEWVVFGGEFPKVNGTKQQGLVRFRSSAAAPNKMGPQLQKATTVKDANGKTSTVIVDVPYTPAAAVQKTGGVKLTWPLAYDRDNQWLTYTVYRDGVLIATKRLSSGVWHGGATTTLTDAAGTQGAEYQVVATDPFGNTLTGPAGVAK